jgi:serine/threonine protein kinase
MNAQDQSDQSDAPGFSFRRVDELCDEFEAAWKSGSSRPIHSFLTGLDSEERLLALRELLHTELGLRKNAGQTPGISSYLSDFPDEGTLVRRIFHRHFPAGSIADDETVITGGSKSSPDSDADTSGQTGVRSTWLWKSGSDSIAEMRAFARRVVEAGLMTEDDLAALREELPEMRLPVTPGELASILQERDILTDYQVAVLRGWTTEPLVLGNYLILDVIGSGGMGHVYKARHRRMDRIVALKVLSPDLISSRNAISRFQKEVRAAARLEHPNVVMAYDADEDNGVHFLVMQYVDGRDLGSVVKTAGCLSPLRALECVLQVAEGLEYAHNQGVIHRDIKPTNLLLDHNGTVRILDMGLARIGPTGSVDSQKRSLLGTVDFMAPEQALDSRKADGRADIYSLGCTLWWLVNGRRMFGGKKITQRLQAHRESPRPKLDTQGTGLEEIQTLFESMVAIDPADRFQSTAEVVLAIESCLRQLRVDREDDRLGESTTVNTDPAVLNGQSSEEQFESPEAALIGSSLTATVGRPRKLIALTSLLVALGLLWLLISLSK